MEWTSAVIRSYEWGQKGNRMRLQAFTALVIFSALDLFPVWAAEPISGTILVTPDDPDAPPHDPSRLILPGQPAGPGLPVPTLPPLWLMPLPDQATRTAERARLDAALEEKFAHLAPPPQSFDQDIIPLAAGLPWQAMQRRVDGTLGDTKIRLIP